MSDRIEPDQRYATRPLSGGSDLAKRIRLLVLQDSPGFGGHEIMFLRLLPGILDSAAFDPIVFAIPEVNETLEKQLKQVAGRQAEILKTPFVKERGEPYRAPVRMHYRAYVQRLLEQYRPDVVLLLQGRIENLCVPALVCSGKVPLVSYIPMAHSVAEIRGPGVMSKASDLVRQAYYARPDAFVVPAASIEAQLRAQGVSQPVTVAPNTLPSKPVLPSRAEARRLLGLDPAALVASFIGRLDLHQKGLDLLVDAIARSTPLPRWSFLMVGSGPDEANVRARVEAAGLSRVVTFLSWTDQPQNVYAASDILLMPSRYEGVPLVMLEALVSGVPILGNDIDVYREYLPREWIVDFGSTRSLAADLDRVLRHPLPDTATGTRILDLEGSSRLLVDAVVSAALKRPGLST